MAIYAFFSFVAFLLYLQAAVYFYRMMPGTKANRLFVMVLASLATTSIFIFTRQFIHDIQLIYILDRFAAVAWILFPLLATSYVTLASDSPVNKNISHTIQYILLPMAFILSARYIAHPQSLKHYYMAESGIWYFTTNISAWWTIMALIYGFINASLGSFVLYQWMKRSKNGKYKKEMIKARLTFFSVLAFATISLISVMIIPLLGSTMLPSMMHILSLPTITVIFLSAVMLHPRAFFREMISNLFMQRIREYVFYLDHTGKIYSVNDYTLEKLGYLPMEMENKDADVFFKPAKIVNQQIEDVAMNRGGRQVISMLNPKKDEPITVMLSATKVYDDFRNMVGFVILAYDYQHTYALYKENKVRLRLEQRLVNINKELERRIEAREGTLLKTRDRLYLEDQRQQIAEQKIISELRRKEKIIYEIHHRIKNNMQMVVSLLNLEQNKNGTREHIKDMCTKIAGRVRDISIIHDYMYDSPNLGNINFTNFLQRTSDDLKGRFSHAGNVFFNISSSHLLLTVDKAIPCGIIVFELINNSLQHAFMKRSLPNEITGLNKNDQAELLAIHIEFFKSNDAYWLSVTDNGCGLSMQNDGPAEKRIGLSLVELLTNDYLKGAINYDATTGTKVTIQFS